MSPRRASVRGAEDCQRWLCCYSPVNLEDGNAMPKFKRGHLLRGSLPHHPTICVQSHSSLQFSARFHTSTEGRYTCTHPLDTMDSSGAHLLCYVEVHGQMLVSADGCEILLQKPRIETLLGGCRWPEDSKVTVGALSPSRGEYEVTLSRPDHDGEQTLGLTLRQQDGMLIIESILQPGRVHDWNQMNSKMPVSPGDEILRVNGESPRRAGGGGGSAAQRLDEVMAGGNLQLKLRRRGFTFAGHLSLGITPEWSEWPLEDVMLEECDLDIRCGGVLSQVLLREHVINWLSLSAIALVAVPFSTCEDGYRHWVPALSLPLLARGLYKEITLFWEHFSPNHRLMNELVGFTNPAIMLISSRIEQLDIMTDTLFVARALQCSESVTAEWQASWEQVPVVGPPLGAAAGALGYGGFTVLLYLATVLLPQGVLGYAHGRDLTLSETSFEVDPCGVSGCQDILPLQDLASTACFGLIEKSLEVHAQVQYNSGEPVVNEDVRLPFRIFVRSCLENFLQLWNQVTFLSLTYSPDTMADLQVGGSIVLSLALLLIKVHKLASTEEYTRTVLWQVVTLPIQGLQLLMSIIATSFMWGISAMPLTDYSVEEAMRAQTCDDEALRAKYQLGGAFDALELAAIRAAGDQPLTMALRRHFHTLGLTSHRFTRWPKAKVVAAALLWCVLLVLMRLAGVFVCSSHSWNLSTMTCLPMDKVRGVAS
mmetsp:Transcript_136959/g.355676  ORF Transcript_136959/g.355676 Transcript_136959/m.355676 type:complete len:708 (+) Transcript_136959:1220-3343(+)